MKTLFLIRHAKSSSGYMGMPDHSRPLNKRGHNAATIMGLRMAKRDRPPELLISSSAVRAWSTTELIANELDYRVNDIAIEPRIYEASAQTLLTIIQGLDNYFNRTALIGHNPGFTIAANMLGNLNIDNMPTTGIVVLQFDVEAWSHVSPGLGELVLYDYPKNVA